MDSKEDSKINTDESLFAGDTLHSDDTLDPRVLASGITQVADDTEMLSLTFRVWVLGLCFSAGLAFVNMYYWFRSNPILLGISVVQLLSLPAGWVLSKTLPKRQFNTFGFRWSMNPGDFTIKEHVLVSVLANASTGTVYALDIISVKKFWLGSPLSFAASALMTLSAQLVGYSFTGLFYRFLVTPDAMVWPSTLVSVTLFKTLSGMVASKDGPKPQGRSRLRVFWIAFACSFVWYFAPGWAFPTLTMIPILCLAAPKNIYAHQLGDGYNGLGMLALSLDWSTISNAYTGSPLGTPWFAACNLFVGFVIVMWVITPIGYYSGVWGSDVLPIYSSNLFTLDGAEYNVSRVLRDGSLDEDAYAAYSPMRLSFEFALVYGLGFMGITCLLSHAALNYGTEIWHTARGLFARRHMTAGEQILAVHKDVPLYWYAVVFVATMAMGISACVVYELLPWSGFILAVAVSGLLTLPVGLVEAVSNFQYGLGLITELIAGYIWPGEPTYNAVFKMFGYITMKQALLLTKDQKLAYYLKVSPRDLFVCQIMGTVIAVFVQLGTAFWLMDSVEGICTDAGFPFTCRQARMFYSSTVIWGVIGPQRMFSEPYRPLYWLFLVGVFLPLPFWLLKRKYPRNIIWRHVNLPVALTYLGYMPNAPTHDFVMFTAFCFVFNYVLLKYRNSWWRKYNFALSAALDSGLAISGIVGYFALQSVSLDWWGTRDHCPLSTVPVKHS